MADEIRADYTQLQQVATQFSRQATAINRMQQQMKHSLGGLQGNWIGHGSEAFFSEMRDKVLPATQRLADALRAAQKVTQQISQVLRAAEEDAAAPFQGAVERGVTVQREGLPQGGASAGGGGGGTSFIASAYAPLTDAQWLASKRTARVFGLPAELVAGAVAVEIVDDTDWTDAPLDLFLQKIPLSAHYNCCRNSSPDVLCGAVDSFLAGYEHYFDLLGGRGPGNGVANMHIATAKEAEEYFATEYPGQGLLPTPPDHFARATILLSDTGNIYYTAAILRRIADYRTGIKGSHVDDLSVLDMQMIYGRFRCLCWDSWSDFAESTEPFRPGEYDSRGQMITPYLELYRGRQ